MTADLPDTNVWVALATDRHRHHQVAVEWFDSLADNASARFCRMTQNSFLRLMTVVEFQKEDTLSNVEAMEVHDRLRGDPRVGWSDESPGVEDRWFRLARLSTPSPKRWMDAYLAAFALAGDLRLVTFDSGFRQFRREGLEVLVLGHSAKS
ncbi:MAG: PIN domain-containing protein [Verrucomicrobiales bacterium]|nr:PIN domain-containing protein [Verrucomicrobiales bacterium]